MNTLTHYHEKIEAMSSDTHDSIDPIIKEHRLIALQHYKEEAEEKLTAMLHEFEDCELITDDEYHQLEDVLMKLIIRFQEV